MKEHRSTLRFSITIWFMILTFVVVILMLTAFTIISSSVFRRTIREYLIGAVEANVDKIIYVN